MQSVPLNALRRVGIVWLSMPYLGEALTTMQEKIHSPHSFIRAKRPDGSERTIDLIELEDALEGVFPGQAYFDTGSGRTTVLSDDDSIDIADGAADEDGGASDNAEMIPIDAISSHTRFDWMEDFIETVHSIPLQSSLRRALRDRKPFRGFKDALVEYPAERELWFQFAAQKLKAEAVSLLESLDWEVLEVVDGRPVKAVSVEVDPAERVPVTTDEHDWYCAAVGRSPHAEDVHNWLVS
jgi:hypothetical protein